MYNISECTYNMRLNNTLEKGKFWHVKTVSLKSMKIMLADWRGNNGIGRIGIAEPGY